MAMAGDRIYLFDAATSKHLRSLAFLDESNDGPTIIRAMSWSPDGPTIASTTRANAAEEGPVVLWDAETGKIRAMLSGHLFTPMDLA
jgi:WD40 repeat protein